MCNLQFIWAKMCMSVRFFSFLNDTSIPLWIQYHNKLSGLSRRKHAYLERTKNTLVFSSVFDMLVQLTHPFLSVSLSSHTNFTHYFTVEPFSLSLVSVNKVDSRQYFFLVRFSLDLDFGISLVLKVTKGNSQKENLVQILMHFQLPAVHCRKQQQQYGNSIDI